MPERDDTQGFVRRHKRLIAFLAVLVVLYVGASIWHRVTSFDYTDRAVAAAETAHNRGQEIGTLTQAQNNAWQTTSQPTLADVEKLIKPGNQVFDSLFNTLVARSPALSTTAADRRHENACFLFPVVPRAGDPIGKLIGLSRVCFDNANPSRPYSGSSLSISNR